MSVTAILWATLYAASAVLTFFNPLFGALGYLLEYYMRPELKWWGDELPVLRYNLIISLALGLSFVLRRTSLREMAPVKNPTLYWLCAMGATMVLVTATVAVNQQISLDWMIQWHKMAIIFPLLLVGVIRSRQGFNAFVVVNMLGAFWWGWEAYTDPKRSAGRLVNIGSGDSLDDNAAAAHLLTVLPMIFVFVVTEKDKWLKGAALLAAPFVANTLILCNSRGSIVGLGVAGILAMGLLRSGYRMRLVAVGLALLLGGYALADDQFITRQQTTTNYEEDGSALQRLMTWQGGLRLVSERPLGAGGRGFHLLSPIYIPEVVAIHGGDPRAPHNTWVMVASEWGVLGLICFVGMYGSAFLTLGKVKKGWKKGDDGFYYWRAFALQLSIIAYSFASIFSDRLYGEAGYWVLGLSFALYRVQCTERAETAAVAVPAAVDARSPHAPWSAKPVHTV